MSSRLRPAQAGSAVQRSGDLQSLAARLHTIHSCVNKAGTKRRVLGDNTAKESSRAASGRRREQGRLDEFDEAPWHCLDSNTTTRKAACRPPVTRGGGRQSRRGGPEKLRRTGGIGGGVGCSLTQRDSASHWSITPGSARRLSAPPSPHLASQAPQLWQGQRAGEPQRSGAASYRQDARSAV